MIRLIRSLSVLGSSAQASDVKPSYSDRKLKDPRLTSGLFVELGALSISYPGLGRGLLDRLVSVAR